MSAATGRDARQPLPAGAGRLLVLGGRGRRRLLLAVVLGVSGELCAIGLLATGAWLLLSAALRPPILTLSVAIAAVQVFALARGAARYGERLASHDLGLGLQRLGVARAVLAGRPVLLLDEPTSHLDPATAEAVLATVLALARDRSLLWVSHRSEELAAFPVVLDLGTRR